MNVYRESIIGIVGGMGPEAGACLFNAVLACSNATSDQDHVPMVLMSFPGSIADRTAFLEGKTNENPGYKIADIIDLLEKSGANVIGIACNTSHASRIFNVIIEIMATRHSTSQLLHMPEETVKYIKENCKHVKSVGIMATNGTYQSRLYCNVLQDWGYTAVVPEFEFQNNVIHKMVYDSQFGIKATSGYITNEVRTLLKQSISYFRQKQVDAVILGCTEFSLLAKEELPSDLCFIDSSQAFAQSLYKTARQNTLSSAARQG